MLHPTVFNTSQICHQLGVQHAVLSPGSRNAPLTISFARNSKITKHIIPDERSAAFIALGIAQEAKSPVALICTSGTALLNYAPAIAEAYYRQIPLIVLSADRPPELIDQRDGQTIRQFDALKNHVKKSFQLPDIKNEEDKLSYQAQLENAVGLTQSLPQGPIHVNIPFSEPFYPAEGQDLSFQEISLEKQNLKDQKEFSYSIPTVKKVLILVGQQHEEELEKTLENTSQTVPVISSPLNNLHGTLKHVDGFIKDQEELRPDLLITSGLSVLSKNLKVFLRKLKPANHIHCDPAGVEVDTYQSTPDLVKESLEKLLPLVPTDEIDKGYLELWKKYSNTTRHAIDSFISTAKFSEASASHLVLNTLPKESILHLSNSMPVRYGDLFDINQPVKVLSNRGTSGIDGCTSTAVGTAMISEKMNVLITGDLAFLYDRNAFFHNYKVPNLRIVVMNNAGGGIFRLIDGPFKLDELEDYFETRHNRTAKYICAENDLEYLPVRSEEELEHKISGFYDSSQNTKVMEIFTEPETNRNVYKNLRKYINAQINN